LTLIGDVSYSQLSTIEDKIDDLLLPYSFDISIFSNIENPDLIDNINRIGVIFYENAI